MTPFSAEGDEPIEPTATTSRRKLLSRFGLAGIGAAVLPGQGIAAPRYRTLDAGAGDVPGMHNVRAYGAKGDGVADDSAAFQTAVDEIAAAGKGVLYVPPGDYRIASRISKEIDVWKIAITGEGQGISNLLSDNADGVFRFVHPNSHSQTTIQELSFFTARSGGGTAVEIESPERGNRHNRNLVVQNVEMRGIDRTTGYFNYGFRSLRQWRPLFLNVIFAGPFGRGVPDEEIFAAECGFDADGSYAPSFQHCYAWSAKTAYRVRSPMVPAAPEDTAFYRSFAVECEVGMDIWTEPIEPQVEIDTCHINCRKVGVRIHHRKYFQITNNLFYNVDWDDKYPGYNDIELIGCFGGIITDNIFHQPANSNRKMVAISGRSYDLQIKDNLFNATGTAVHVADRARGIVCTDNQYHEEWVTKRIDGEMAGVAFRSHRNQGVLLERSSPQRIEDGAWTELEWENSEYDTDSFRSDSGRVTIPAGRGIRLVRLSGSVSWANKTDGVFNVEFTRNGDAAFAGNGRESDVSARGDESPVVQNLHSAVIPVTDGDEIALRVRQTTGSPATIETGWLALEVVSG